MKNQYFIGQTSNLDSVISDILQSVEEGYNWGNAVAIGLTACLLAIALVHFLFDRS